MTIFSIVTDYESGAEWRLSDNGGTLIHAAAVGALAQDGSKIGADLAEQTEVYRDMVDSIADLRDNSAKFTPEGFPPMQIVGGKILPPADVDVSALLSSGLDIYGQNTSLATIDKLVSLETWLDQTFGPTTSPAVKVTYRLPGETEDAWMVLKDVVPVPTVPPGGFPTTPTGAMALNTPFVREGQAGTLMLVKDENLATVTVTLKSIDEVFSKVSSLKEYQDYITSLAVSRSDEALRLLGQNNITGFSYDAIAWRKPGETTYNYAQLPVISIQSADRTSTVAPAGSILLTEKKEYYYVVLPKTGSTNAVTEKVEVGSSFLIAPTASILSSIRSLYGDQITIATQISAQQGLFVNELMQKYSMYFDAASNVLKAFVDLKNRISNQI